jgi:hypothetical protein
MHAKNSPKLKDITCTEDQWCWVRDQRFQYQAEYPVRNLRPAGRAKRYTTGLAADILANGLRNPLICVSLDDHEHNPYNWENMAVREGNSRLIALQKLGAVNCPVLIWGKGTLTVEEANRHITEGYIDVGHAGPRMYGTRNPREEFGGGHTT